jgi:hypothetical protein
VPVRPLIVQDAQSFSMFESLRMYPWMLPIYRYASPDDLLTSLQEQVIAPAEAEVIELRKLRHKDSDPEP